MGLFEQKPVSFMIGHNNVLVRLRGLARPTRIVNENKRYSRGFERVDPKNQWLFRAVFIVKERNLTYAHGPKGESYEVTSGLVTGIFDDRVREGFATIDTDWQEGHNEPLLELWMETAEASMMRTDWHRVTI